MSEQQPAQQGTWQALVIRLTAFTPTTEKVAADEWWETLVGHASEAQVKRKSGVFQELGQFGPGRLVLSVEPGRMDWRLVPAETEDIPEEGIPTIGDFLEVLDSFIPMMFRWLNEFSPDLKRLAFGLELSLPISSRSEGYQRLAPFLQSLNIDPERSQDLLYQINRPRPTQTGIPDLIINRLSKWGVKMLAVGSLSIGQSLNITDLGIPFISSEIDINTAAEYTNILPREQLQHIFQELVNFGVEIAQKGDIP